MSIFKKKKNPNPPCCVTEMKINLLEREIKLLKEELLLLNYICQTFPYKILWATSPFFTVEAFEAQEEGYRLKKVFEEGKRQLWIKETKSSPAMDAKEK